jgi:hypothetical protein
MREDGRIVGGESGRKKYITEDWKKSPENRTESLRSACANRMNESLCDVVRTAN